VFPYSFAAYVGFMSDKRILLKLASDGCHAARGFFPQVRGKIMDFVSAYGIRYFFVDSDYVSFEELGVDNASLIKKVGKFELYEVDYSSEIDREQCGTSLTALTV